MKKLRNINVIKLFTKAILYSPKYLTITICLKTKMKMNVKGFQKKNQPDAGHDRANEKSRKRSRNVKENRKDIFSYEISKF